MGLSAEAIKKVDQVMEKLKDERKDSRVEFIFTWLGVVICESELSLNPLALRELVMARILRECPKCGGTDNKCSLCEGSGKVNGPAEEYYCIFALA